MYIIIYIRYTHILKRNPYSYVTIRFLGELYMCPNAFFEDDLETNGYIEAIADWYTFSRVRRHNYYFERL